MPLTPPMQKLRFDGYVGNFAQPTNAGVDEVFEFLNAAGRSPQVYARLYEKVEESVMAGLFWGVWKKVANDSPQLTATSAIFLHGKGPIAITRNGSSNQEYGTFVEHGATLRRKEREGELHPKGVFLQLLMAAPLVQLFVVAGEEQLPNKPPLQVDVVVDNVQQGPQSDYVRNFIRGEPHNWEELTAPSADLLRRFESSVDDENVDRKKDFNRFYVTSIPAMARILLKALETGSVSAEYKGVLYEANIDLLGLPKKLKAALPIIAANPHNFFSEEKMDKRTSFREARRLFEKHLVAAKLEQLSNAIMEEDQNTTIDRAAREVA